MALFRAARSKHPDWTCVALLPASVDVARIVTGPAGRPEVAICDSFRKEGSDRAALVRLRRALKLDDGPCTTLLAPGQYHIAQIDTPRVPAPELIAALRWQIRDMVPFPVEQATVDALPIPAGAAGQRHLVVAAPNETVAAVMDVFHEAGISLAAIDVPELAQRNAAQLLEEPGRALALLVFDSEDPLLTITAAGELCQARRIELPSPGVTVSDPDQRHAQFERVALELQRSLDHYDRQFPAQRVSRLVVSAVPGADGLPAHLASGLGVPVATLDLRPVLDCSRIPELTDLHRQTQCVQMLGAALRERAL